jgi:hypothetical protein
MFILVLLRDAKEKRERYHDVFAPRRVTVERACFPGANERSLAIERAPSPIARLRAFANALVNPVNCRMRSVRIIN